LPTRRDAKKTLGLIFKIIQFNRKYKNFTAEKLPGRMPSFVLLAKLIDLDKLMSDKYVT